ncbi:DEAD/DEAH box helicase [Bradyrhizobium sp. Leo170]|uniref:DEAD/DEAH box helicase n=1 Tax=Bradyrhizobium sp. Leo170 TaxID=1571199 RepID=UPI00102EBD3B|nr:DEAD/DEAH box helicase [Bradyrhizobium sp. Leo170]TAI62020.1 hypothetical protein CWO89_32015 [Bradyrhizobium sp. Leo170]
MNSPASGSGLEAAYHLLHPKVRRWIRDQGWDELREIQARTILAVLEDDRDILISATTAAGKTEAAFLPILTSIAERSASGFSVLYVSPLKALINDQFRRLEGLCESMEIPVVKWHGDAPQAEKKKAMNKPDGIALITPESIEAMFVRRPADAKRLLSVAEFIVVDELHSFLQGPRGLHVASLLRRIDAMAARPARRVGLSATIGDLGQARAWLRPTNPGSVEQLVANSDAPELRLQVRGYIEPPDLDDPGGVVPRFEPATGEPAHDRLIAEMRKVYLADDVPPYLDARARDLLEEGREMFRELDLESRSLVQEDRDMHVFLWRGSQATAVFSAALAMAGLQSGVHELGVTVSKIKESELRPILSKLAETRNIGPHDVSEFVANIKVGKFREQVPENLARSLWARQNGDKVTEIPVMAAAL